MVMFVCNHCGECLQKPRVEKHYLFSCRTPKALTCQDCFKDYKNEEYAEHTKCVSEEQRYSAKGSITEVVKKGEAKQANWVQMVKNIIVKDPNLPLKYTNYLNSLSASENIPRIRKKFIRFVKNNSSVRMSTEDIDGLWDIIENHKDELAPNRKNNEKIEVKNENDSPKTKAELNDIQDNKGENIPKEKKKNKRKKSQVHNAEQNTNSVNIKTDLETEVKIEDLPEKENGKLQINETVSKTKKKRDKSQNAIRNDSEVELKEADGNVHEIEDLEVNKKANKKKRRARDAGETSEVAGEIQINEELQATSVKEGADITVKGSVKKRKSTINNLSTNENAENLETLNNSEVQDENSCIERKVSKKNKSQTDIKSDSQIENLEVSKKANKKKRRARDSRAASEEAGETQDIPELQVTSVKENGDISGSSSKKRKSVISNLPNNENGEIFEKLKNSEVQENCTEKFSTEQKISKKNKSQNDESEVKLKETYGNEISKKAKKKRARDAGETSEVAGEIQINEELPATSVKEKKRKKSDINDLSANENSELQINAEVNIRKKKKDKSQNAIRNDIGMEVNKKKKRARDAGETSEVAGEIQINEEVQAISVKDGADITVRGSIKKKKSVINNENEENLESLNSSEIQDDRTEQKVSKKNKSHNGIKSDSKIEDLEPSKKANKKRRSGRDADETSEVAGEIQIDEELPATYVKEKKRRKSDINNLSGNEKSIETLNGSEVQDDCTQKFSIEQEISDILKTRNSISLNKLEKKVTNACRKSGNFKSEEKIQKKLHKKLKEMSNIEIDENNVKLVVV